MGYALVFALVIARANWPWLAAGALAGALVVWLVLFLLATRSGI